MYCSIEDRVGMSKVCVVELRLRKHSRSTTNLDSMVVKESKEWE